jgi:hypothetical protein
MSDELLLVGSIPLETAEAVFRSLGGPLGQYLAYMPDGEIGDRQYWIDGIGYRVLNGHPEIETLKRPAPDANGVERWRPLGIHDQFRFRVKPGVERVRFGDPGWRLGYTRDAVASYYVFRQLKKDGVIPARVRFQVCLPLTYSAVTSFFPDPADQPRIVPGFTAALGAEVAKIIELIPPDDLAIQWDLAVENRYVEAVLAKEGPEAAKREAERVMIPAREISLHIPAAVALGYHSCYGTLDGWPSRQPSDLSGSVLLLNAAVAASGRRVEFIHLPTLGSAADAVFAPLKDLQAAGARVYLGAIHHMHDQAGLADQLRAAKKYLGEFGLSAPCGFGRAQERPGRLLSAAGTAPPPDPMAAIIKDHVAAVATLRQVMAR